MRSSCVALVLVAASAPTAEGQQREIGGQPDNGTPSAFATRITQPVVLDGILNERQWARAASITEFLQKDPVEGAPATERSDVRLLFDARNLYVGVFAYDSNRSGIRATELRRDSAMESDDVFEIILDSLHDHRSGFLFRINPLGTLYDAAVINDGQIINENWDEKWEAQARTTDEGWVAEIRIPFTALRFRETADVTWGINFHRTIKRKNEDVFWTAHNRSYAFEEVSRAGHVLGLSGMQGLRLRVKPFAVIGARRSDGVDAEHSTAVGIEDAKYLVTPQLALDLAVNPDFAQADVDEAQVNLTRFSLFFPERREFFQEGAGIFDFGAGQDDEGSEPEILLFHSRRIGLSEDREEIPITGGLKLTGRQGPFDIGLLNMQTRRSEGLAGQNFTVARLKANVLTRSYIGAIFTRNTAGATGPADQAGGVDANFTFFENLNLRGFVARNGAEGTDEGEWGGHATAEWDSDRYQAYLEHMSIQENFRPQLGFIAREEDDWKGIQRSLGGGAYRPRPRIPLVRQFEFAGAVDYIADQNGVLDTREVEVGWETEFESGEELSIEWSDNFERLRTPLDFRGSDAVVPPGAHSWYDLRLMAETFEGRPLSARLEMELGQFYNGRATTVELSTEYRPTANLSLEPSMEWNRISLPGSPAFTAVELNADVHFAFTQRWLTTSTFLLNTQDQEYSVNFRLNYIFRPEDDLFLVYNETHAYGEGGPPPNRALLVKLTYSFDL